MEVINQRYGGQTNFTFNEATIGYHVDRWINNFNPGNSADIGTMIINKTGLKITATAGSKQQTIEQYIEDYKKLYGKNVTLSMKYRGNGKACLYLATLKYYSSSNMVSALPINKELTCDGNWHTVNITGFIPNDSDINYIFTGIGCGTSNGTGFNITTDSDIEVEWIKLEEGNIATRYLIPYIHDELLHCRRYYQVRDGGSCDILISSDGGTLDIRTWLVTPMRTNIISGNKINLEWTWARVTGSKDIFKYGFMVGTDFGKFVSVSSCQPCIGNAVNVYCNWTDVMTLDKDLISAELFNVRDLIIRIDCEIYIE